MSVPLVWMYVYAIPVKMLSSFWETCISMCIDDKCDFISDFLLSYFYDSSCLKSCLFNVLNTSKASPYRSDRTLTTAYMLTYRYTYVYCMSNKSSKVQVSTFGPLYYIIKTKCGDPLFLYPLLLYREGCMKCWYAMLLFCSWFQLFWGCAHLTLLRKVQTICRDLSYFLKLWK